MASLRKQKKSSVWYAQFYVPDGDGGLKQIRKTTGCTNKSKAKVAAVELERTHRGTIEAGSDKASKAQAIFAEAVAEIQKETFTTLSARKALARLLSIATGEEMPAYTLETWTAEWLRRKEAAKSSKATMARYKSHTKAFLDWLGDDRREKPLESVTTKHVHDWKQKLQDEGRTGKTVLSYVKDIGGIFRAAMREGIVSFNPCGTAISEIDTSDSHPRTQFQDAEFALILENAPSPEWRGVILTAAFTGLRLADAARLSWSSVDLEAKRITLIPSKTKKKKREVRIPIQPDLLAYLENATITSDSPDAPVFPTLSRKQVNGAIGLSDGFTAIMATAGVDRGKPSRTRAEGEEKGAGRITWEKGFHSLRHTFTSWLRNAGVSEEDRMTLTGHSTRDSHAIYSHATDKTSEAAIAKLPSLASTAANTKKPQA